MSLTRRWEAPSSTGGKFWQVVQDGCSITTTWGKLTAKGSSKTTVYEDEEKAVKFVETTIRKKEKEGYVLKTAKSASKSMVSEEKEEKETKVPPKTKVPAKKAAPKKVAKAPVKKTKAPVKKVVEEEIEEEEIEEEEIEEEVDEDGGVPTSYVLPPIYNTDSKGKERVHLSWVKGNVLTKKHGETDGKHTLADRSFEGKNIGRANETDANEQACREGERDWVKQVNKGYKPKISDKKGYAVYKLVIAEKAKQGGVNTNTWMILAKELRGVEIAAPKPKSATAAKTAAAKSKKKANNGTLPGYKSDLFPMGCQKLVPPNRPATDPEPKVLKYMNFENGVYIQRKLDGIRCLVRIVEHPDSGEKYVVMTSRASNQFVHLKSLRAQVLDFLKGREDVVLDCEVYQHEIRASVTYKKVGGKNKVVFGEGDEIIPRIMNFKAITSTVRSSMTDPGPLEDQMCLYVFDIVDPTEELTQDERFEQLDALFARKGIAKKCPRMIQVERFEISSPEEIPEYQDKFVKEGYEGVVLRDKALKYECLQKNKKSKWMRKYKYFFDAEFEIVGVERDKGVPREQFSWICRTENGVKFKAKPEGTREMKWEWYDNKEEIIGKMLIVRYQDLEDSGKPRFPIAIEIRDFE
jgi:predicted DNA-binding WGR domain protein